MVVVYAIRKGFPLAVSWATYGGSLSHVRVGEFSQPVPPDTNEIDWEVRMGVEPDGSIAKVVVEIVPDMKEARQPDPDG